MLQYRNLDLCLKTEGGEASIGRDGEGEVKEGRYKVSRVTFCDGHSQMVTFKVCGGWKPKNIKLAQD